MKRINLDNIDFNLEYEGYIWYSNQQKPELRKKIEKEDFTDLPFIIEGNLYAKNEEISISIKYVDGAYFITQGEIKNLPESQITHQEFLTHGFKKEEKINKIKMIQFWEESESDDLLEGMKTLKPSWKAFIGFIKN